MPETDWLQQEPAASLLNTMVAAVLRQYRIDAQEARRLAGDVLTSNRAVREALDLQLSADRIARTRAFKDALTDFKREIYRDLRRYTTDVQKQEQLIADLGNAKDVGAVSDVAQKVAATHASSRERLPELDSFYGQLRSVIGKPTTIVDVGCGMQPLLFPFHQYPELLRYIALDKDRQAIHAITAFSNGKPEPRLMAIAWRMEGGWSTALARAGVERFDVALMLKLIPIVMRQTPQLLHVLNQTPADLWLITGSKFALTKKRSIERRERADLLKFVSATGRHIAAELTVGEEFGYLLEA